MARAYGNLPKSGARNGTLSTRTPNPLLAPKGALRAKAGTLHGNIYWPSLLARQKLGGNSFLFKKTNRML